MFVEFLRSQDDAKFVAFVANLRERQFNAAFEEAFGGRVIELWRQFVATLAGN